jgi:NAD+ synthase
MDILPQLQLDLTRTADHLKRALAAEVRHTGLERAVLGLSGGVDSALAAFLTAGALGAENLHCVMMPYRTSSPDSLAHARLVADKLGVATEVVDISPMVDAMIDTDPAMNTLRRGNIMARQRMITLYDRSARGQAVVIGTGNKTETLLGYSTLFGDSACAMNPLGNLYKTQVWELARFMGVPDAVIDKAPSADLWAGQTDEQELGITYRMADEILYFMFDEKLTDAGITAMGYDADTVKKVREREERYRFKRMMPVVIAL